MEEKVRYKILPGPWLEGEEKCSLDSWTSLGAALARWGEGTQRELWDKIKATQLSHCHLLSPCILGANCGLGMLRMLEGVRGKEAPSALPELTI